MERRRAKASGLLAGLLVLAGAVAAAPQARAVAPARAEAEGPADSMVMVLDSSGSMSEPDGSGGTRMASAKKAVNTVVDGLPDGYLTGLRVYGATKQKSCTDTTLPVPVAPLDRATVKKAVAEVEPRGDTPIGYSLTKAAEDLPDRSRGTILLISDGEDNCGDPPPCEVAEQLAGEGVDLRIDTIGFQVGGKARKQLQCISDVAHGYYYDAPDAAALARQLERASRLSSHAYKLRGGSVKGGGDAGSAPSIKPGQYVDTIGAGETRWYSMDLDSVSAADLAVTAVPRPGVRAGYGDGLDLKLTDSSKYTLTCASDSAHFQQDEGAMPVTGAVGRIPSQDGNDTCDKAGRYLLSVTRTSADGSDQARWPIELRYGLEAPLDKDVTPAAAETGYAKPDKPLTAAPKDIDGGSGFNDARAIGHGVWRDEVLPAQTRFYKVRVGWGQQLNYTVEYANEPVVAEGYHSTHVDTDLFTPSRTPVPDGSEFTSSRTYSGELLSVDQGTVPVTWTNRWVNENAVTPVHAPGDYTIAVSLGPDAEKLARNAAVDVVLRVNVIGDELSGPQHRARSVAADGKDGKDGEDGKDGKEGGRDSAAADEGGFPVVALAGIGGGAALLLVVVVALVARQRRSTR